MKPDPAQIAKLLNELEAYLKRIARGLASRQEDQLLAFLRAILCDISPNSKLLRQAFGFPTEPTISRGLANLLSSNEPSFRPIISIYAQRVHQFLWRCQYTASGIDVDWKHDALKKITLLSQLCEPYLLNLRPTLVDLNSALQHRADLKRFSESAADPTLFAVLRAFDYAEAGIIVSEEEKRKMKANALAFIYDYLIAIVDGKQHLDDSSNAWWGLRLGLESGDTRFNGLAGKLLNFLPKPIVPSTEVRNLSLVPEIYTELRTSAYSLTSVQAILEAHTSLDEEIRSRLRILINNAGQKLMQTPLSTNLYLACVHYEGLRGYMDSVEHEYISSKMTDSVLKLADFKPVGQFVCADATLNLEIRELLKWLKSGRKKRDSVLVYGASSTGKSFLIEQLFAEFGQEHVYKDRRIVCAPTVKVPSELQRILSLTISGNSSPFLFLDEVDVEFPESIFTTVLPLLEEGRIGNPPIKTEDFVLFWAGGKHGSLQEFQMFLNKRKKSKQFEKGLDLYNRGKRLELPISLVRNKNQKLLLGLAAIVNKFGTPLNIDENIFQILRTLPMANKQGVREFVQFADRCQLRNGIVLLPDEEPSGHHVKVES